MSASWNYHWDHMLVQSLSKCLRSSTLQIEWPQGVHQVYCDPLRDALLRTACPTVSFKRDFVGIVAHRLITLLYPSIANTVMTSAACRSIANVVHDKEQAQGSTKEPQKRKFPTQSRQSLKCLASMYTPRSGYALPQHEGTTVTPALERNQKLTKCPRSPPQAPSNRP